MALKKLPIGLSSLGEIINNNYILNQIEDTNFSC